MGFAIILRIWQCCFSGYLLIYTVISVNNIPFSSSLWLRLRYHNVIKFRLIKVFHIIYVRSEIKPFFRLLIAPAKK